MTESIPFSLLAPVLLACDDRKRRVPLVPEAGNASRYIGAPGTGAAGIQATVAARGRSGGTSLALTVSSDSPRLGIQIILPLELDLSWQSYVIAPGVMYNGNRFL